MWEVPCFVCSVVGCVADWQQEARSPRSSRCRRFNVPETKDWCHLVEQVGKETDPAQMLRLVEELNSALEHEQTSHQKRISDT